MESLEHRRVLATATVSTFADLVDGNVTSIPALIANPGADGKISLREGITAAASSGDTVNFDSSLSGGTITLDRAFQGEIAFGKSLTIDASGLAAGITIDADDPTPGHTGHGIRVFNITDPTAGSSPPLVTIVGLTLKGGDVSFGSPNAGEGGAIRSAAQLIIRDCIFQENEADIGGAIYVQVAGGLTSREVLRIEESVIDNNDASNGAGVAIVSAAATDTVLITGTTISHNLATLFGGGVHANLNDATVTVSGSTIVQNGAPNGGGIYARLDDMASLTLVGTELRENNASSGAGLYADISDQSTLGVEDSSFYDNEATLDGGGIYATLSGSSTLELTDTSFVINDANNSFGGGGGGLYADVATQSTLLLQGTMFDGNEATRNGGGAYASVSDANVEVIRSVFLENNASRGGGLFAEVFNDSSFTTEETIFELNAALSDGGGLYVDVSSASAQIDGSSFVDNGAAVSGGGVYVALNEGATVDIVNSTITGNEAVSANGGGGGGVFGYIAPNADAMLEIRGSQITGNIAADGGGVRVDMAGLGHTQANGSVFNLERSRLEGNRAVNRGGGIFTAIGAGGQATVNESVITGNDAGIALLGPDETNRIPNAGGGMYAYLFTGLTAPTLTIAGSEFSFNTAGQHGGGLALCTKREFSAEIARLSVYNTTFSGNKAGHTTAANDAGEGGGVYLAMFDAGAQALDARFQNATITKNIADHGGGVWTFVPDFDSGSTNDVRLTNSIASENKKHNGAPSNLWGSFNIPLTEFNIIGTDNFDPANITTWRHDTYQPQVLRSDPPSGNIPTDDPKLAPLAWMGGPTRTHRPSNGPNNDSPAIDAGSNALAIIPFTEAPPNQGTPLMTDQRGEGFPRPFDVPGIGSDPGRTVDIGAYEIGLPKVIEVRIRDTSPPGHPQYNFSTVVGSGEQLRTVPIGGANTINVFFSERVTVATGAISVVSARTPTVYFGNMTPNSTQTAWQLTPGNTFIADQLILRIDDALVAGLGGRLDGNWDNPDFLDDSGTDTFPSGNNVVDADDDFIFRFTVLTGDFNHDNKVDAADYILWAKFNGTGSGATHTMGDANGDGVVNQTDHNIWSSQFGTDFTVWPTL